MPTSYWEGVKFPWRLPVEPLCFHSPTERRVKGAVVLFAIPRPDSEIMMAMKLTAQF